MIEHRQGDMFEMVNNPHYALAHGCNCRGVMGAGVALQFARRWPEMEKRYQALCKANLLSPGGMMEYWADDQWIFNLMTQFAPGRNAMLVHIRDSMEQAARCAWFTGLWGIVIPQIGCGIGGLLWENVLEVLESIFHDDRLDLITYTYG